MSPLIRFPSVLPSSVPPRLGAKGRPGPSPKLGKTPAPLADSDLLPERLEPASIDLGNVAVPVALHADRRPEHAVMALR